MTISTGPCVAVKNTSTIDDYRSITVYGHNDAIITVLMHKHLPMKKFMHRYSRSVGLPLCLLRFRLDGEVILENDTPVSLGIVDGDTIEVFEPQTGGLL